MEPRLNLPAPIVVFDTETGGLNADDEIQYPLNIERKVGTAITGKLVKLAAPILEIGAVVISNRNLKELKAFHSLCGPEKDETFEEFLARLDPKALEVNGFGKRLEELKAAPPLSQVLRDFVAWLPKGFIPCGQNVKFDYEMVNYACERFGINFQFKVQPLELTSYSQLYFALPETEIVANYKLATVSEALGISTEGAHTALADVRMTAQCIRKMFDRFSTL